MYQFAIIGCGRISKRHAENIQRVGSLRAVCDIVPEKANELAAAFNAKAYYNIDDLLTNEKDIDIVAVCTPNGLHAEHSIKAMQSGKHVLCEKPLSISTVSALEMIDVEKNTGKKLFVVKSTRYNPLFQDLKRELDKQALGKIYSFHLSCLWNRPKEYYIDWKGKAALDGGTLFTQFSHYIDAALWLFGELEEAKGYKMNAAHEGAIEFEDTGTAALKMKNGAIGTLHWSVNAFKKNHEIALTIIAEKGTVRIGGEYFNEVQYLQTANEIKFSTPKNEANNYSFYKGSMSNHDEVYDHLIRVLENDDHSFTGAAEGLKTVEAIEKIYKAAQNV